MIPEEQHRAVGKDTGETAHVERWNNTLRQRLARFVRKTLSFSKSPMMHDVCLKLFLHRYNHSRRLSFFCENASSSLSHESFFKNVPWERLRLGCFSAAARASILIMLIASLALIAAVFLLILTSLLFANLQQSLAVTVLGSQVSTALALPHVVLFAVILSAALLTLLLTTHLRLLARKDEFSLLANLGWERRHVFWRLLREAGRPGLICGVAGAGMAAALLVPGAAFSGWLVLLAWLISRRIYTWK